ncbi:MAG: ABC transporter substrate-binding protein [Burkholderiales bacterium]
MSGKLTVKAMMGDYPNTLDLKSGKLESSLLDLDFGGIHRPLLAFKRVVNGEFDIAELAVTTFLQAKAVGKPLVLIPAVMFGGKSQHAAIVYNAKRGHLTPRDIVGRRVGVRSSSQTTVMWVRGILQNDYGVDIDNVQWVTFEDGHVAQYKDPPNAVRAPLDKKLFDMLIDGEIDAAVLPPADLKDPRLRPLISDAEAAAIAWTEQKRFFPINHMLTVSESFSASNPAAVREMFRLVAESRKAAPGPNAAGLDPYPLGVEACRKALETAVVYAAQQKLIPRRFEVDELFDDVTRTLM